MPILRAMEKSYSYEIPVGARVFKTNLHFMAHIVKDLRAGFSPIILVVGRQRSGKSFVTIMVCWWLSEVFNQPLVIKDILYYEPDKAVENLNEAARYRPRVLDEAAINLHRRDWQKKSHSAFSKVIISQGVRNDFRLIILLETAKHFPFFLCTPFKADIDTSLLRHCDYMIHVIRRGKFMAFKFVKHHDRDDGKDNHKLFLDQVFYNKKDLPAKLWAEYEVFSRAEKDRILAKIQKSSELEEKEQSAQASVLNKLRAALSKGGGT